MLFKYKRENIKQNRNASFFLKNEYRKTFVIFFLKKE